MSPADFFIALGSQPRDNQIPLLREQEEAIAVLGDEDIRAANHFLGAVRFEGRPLAFAGGRLDAAQFTVARTAVYIAVLEERRGEDAVKADLAVALPGDGGAGFFAG